jgi:hypothetical protein
MNKRTMVKKIQEQEARLFLKLKLDEEGYGEGTLNRKLLRSEWVSIHNLMQSLEIQPDLTLPDAQLSAEIVCKKWGVERSRSIED